MFINVSKVTRIFNLVKDHELKTTIIVLTQSKYLKFKKKMYANFYCKDFMKSHKHYYSKAINIIKVLMNFIYKTIISCMLKTMQVLGNYVFIFKIIQDFHRIKNNRNFQVVAMSTFNKLYHQITWCQEISS